MKPTEDVDLFYTTMLEEFRDKNFDDEEMYPGKYVKTLLNGLISRIK